MATLENRLDALIGASSGGVIGVLNLTPDSFSDGGQHVGTVEAVIHAETMMEDGAHVIDIGGESTAPGSRPIDADVELARLEDAVSTLAPTCPLSIDTYRSVTAARCLALGAMMINDVSALRADPDLAAVVREHRCMLIMTHVKDGPLPHVTDEPRLYQKMIMEIGDFLSSRIDVALAQGIHPEDLILDPGWGRFISLDPEDTWRLLSDLDRLVTRLAPIPLMVSTSRKGFLQVPIADRDPLSQLTSLVGVMKGARLIRSHQPRMARQFLDAAHRMKLLDHGSE